MITLKSYKRIFEDIEIPHWVGDEIKRYNLNAGKRLNTSIEGYFEPYLPKNPITVYRGLGFHIADAPDFLRKLKIKNPVEGAKGVYKTGKVQSWSLSAKIAEQFAGKFIIGGLRLEDSLGIVLKIENLNPEEISIPIAFTPFEFKRKYVTFSEQEEVLIKPGAFQVSIEKLIGDWKSSGTVDLKSVIKSIGLKYSEVFHAELGPTWNKEPGFSLDFPQWKKSTTSSRGKINYWMPSFELHIDGMEIYVELFAGANFQLGPKDREFIRGKLKFDSITDLASYLQSPDLEKRFERAYQILQAIYGKK